VDSDILFPVRETPLRPPSPAIPSGPAAASPESGDAPDDDGFLSLLKRFGDKLYNFAYRLSGNAQDAADLFQEALSRAFRHWDRYDASKPFDAWVGRILYNAHLDEVRRYARKHTVSLDAPSPVEDGQWTDLLPGRDADPADEAARLERDRMIQKALASLPPDYRAAVALCDVEGCSYERIAEIMQCPLGTVRSRIHQGRILFRKSFESLQNKGGDVR
jgi:RNA polymerase sigma-70 factor (ECF subfamily)